MTYILSIVKTEGYNQHYNDISHDNLRVYVLYYQRVLGEVTKGY